MRNLLVLAAAFGLAGVANAQSTAGVTQTGNGNDADLAQAASSSATIIQSTRESGAPAGTAGNTAYLNQSGSTANINQDGEGNVVAGDLGAPPVTLPPTASFSQAGGSDLKVDQNGANNSVMGTQSGGSTADIRQQNDGAVNYDGAAIEITQTDGGDAKVYQRTRGNAAGDYYGGVIAQIDQAGGDLNYVDINQTGGDGSTVMVSQSGGDGNDAIVVQQTLSNPAASLGAGMIDIDQVGSDNYVNTASSKYGASQDIDQTGSDNQVWFDQSEETAITDDGGVAIITQTGNFNFVGSSAADFAQGGASRLEVSQSGDYNSVSGSQSTSSASITQSGTGVAMAEMNSVVLDQTSAFGAGTQAFGAIVGQTGMGNLAEVTQSGDHAADVMQNGVGNTATVVQN